MRSAAVVTAAPRIGIRDEREGAKDHEGNEGEAHGVNLLGVDKTVKHKTET